MKWISLLLVSLVLGCGHSIEANHSEDLLDQLYQRHDQWQGTPYRLGGMSKQGIDCSGFVQLTFAEEFDL